MFYFHCFAFEQTVLCLFYHLPFKLLLLFFPGHGSFSLDTRWIHILTSVWMIFYCLIIFKWTHFQQIFVASTLNRPSFYYSLSFRLSYSIWCAKLKCWLEKRAHNHFNGEILYMSCSSISELLLNDGHKQFHCAKTLEKRSKKKHTHKF